MRFFSGCLVLSLILFSCNLEPATPVSKPQKFDKEKYIQTLKTERDNQNQGKKAKKEVVTSDSLIIPTKPFELYKTPDTVQLKITYGNSKMDTVKLPRQQMVFVLNSDTATKIQLKVIPQDTIANLRISQIIDPKGNSEGPFGQEVVFPVKEKGVHTVIVSENQMQGNPWGGKFSLEAQLIW